MAKIESNEETLQDATSRKKDLLEMIDEKIKEESATVTWTGISIWVVLSFIGIIASQMFRLMGVYGIEDLISIESIYTLLIELLIIFSIVIYVRGQIPNTNMIKPKNIKLNEKVYKLVFLSVYPLALLIVKNIINMSNTTYLILTLSVLPVILINFLFYISIFKYKKIMLKLIKHFIKIGFLYVWTLSTILITILLHLVDYNKYTTQKGADLFFFSTLLLILIIAGVILIYLYNKKSTISRLSKLKINLKFANLAIDEAEEDFRELYVGYNLSEYIDNKLEDIVEIIKEIKEFVSEEYVVSDNIDSLKINTKLGRLLKAKSRIILMEYFNYILIVYRNDFPEMEKKVVENISNLYYERRNIKPLIKKYSKEFRKFNQTKQINQNKQSIKSQ